MALLKNCTTTFKLNTGATIPAVGLGTWNSTDEKEAKGAVVAAIKAGYRHIDTAYIYRNEKQIGEGIKEAINSGLVKREELFVTTKLWCFDQTDPLPALEGSIERLGLDYIDLYLMHWPIPIHKREDANGNLIWQPPLDDPNRAEYFRKDWDFFKTWELMSKLPESGLTKAVGVSNFTAGRLEALCSKGKLIPACNQVQLHPLLPEIELLEVANKYGVILEAYSPLGSQNTPVLKNEFISEIAKKNDIPAANVIFSWIVSRGIVVLPKSVKEARIVSNLKTIDLPKEDMEALTEYASRNGGPARVATSKWLPEGFWEEY
ncbi:trifunctional aldehyde reductase/carbonyl reductase (NADPH)/glucose 1-dehydrogenase (NADP(+)) [Saccharomycopsis crataegensis]|uniref:Trifunctional aldehyde reductase/carbonyl reductase (NADPH)/glucose 1-dehydrogenase (NADP(+)) n=1 Tax=Saccharomycopsis crataegensis TaxID=43959 RepID=A0AAV5QSF4_9ASCO|nr:trifunctional aldehyde reductase/carbonyl reductase (NADPH)/glucose 1-dehydrogenase (NADP(+)) [Saccharomycopsis crataegensis]